MWYLGPALFAEGQTDHLFLRPLLRRLCERLSSAARSPVEVSDVLELHSLRDPRATDRAARICGAAVRAAEAWNLLFVHTDAGGDATAAEQQRIAPALATLTEKLGAQGRGTVAVVPVRMTEAWALVDGEALRQSFGTTMLDAQLGVPRRAKAAGGIADPKATLRAALACSRHGRARRRPVGVKQFLERPGESVSLDRLADVPAFRHCRDHTLRAMRALGVIDSVERPGP